MPYISMVIPVYNTGEALEQCLGSIKKQTFEDFEAVLIDDGSTDASGDVCDRFASLDPRFRVCHQPNAGVSAARNNGMNLATGEWITFIDSDDWVDATYLEHMVNASRECDDIQAVVNTVVSVNDDESFLRWDAVDAASLSSYETVSKALIGDKLCTSMWGYMFKRECLQDIRVDSSLHFYEDMDFLLQAFRSIKRCAVNANGGYHYRQGSYTHMKLTPKTLTAFDVVDKHCRQGVFSEALLDALAAKMILSVAFVGANDPQYDRALQRVLQQRAKAYCKKPNKSAVGRALTYIQLLAKSPKLFYVVQRTKNTLKRHRQHS